MTDSTPLDDTWHSRDLPVLREVVRLTDENLGGLVDASAVAGNLEMDDDDVQRAGVALKNDGLLEIRGGWGLPVMRFSKPTGDARRLAGAWPTPDTALDRMVAALEDLEANAGDEDTRTWAQKTRAAILSGTKTVGLSVMASVITGQLPGQ